MKDNKVKAEEVFGGMTECKGMGTGSKHETLPKEAEYHVPHYHDGEQVEPEKIAISNDEVTEKELSSHF